MIYDISPVNKYNGNNSSTQFDFDFYIENASQLNVFHYDSQDNKTQLEYNVDYSIHETGNSEGSYITFPITGSEYSVLSDTEKISLELTLPISQETQYNNSSLLNLESLEYSFDYLTRICQIQARQLNRAIKVQETSSIDTDELALDLITVADISNDISTVAGISSNVTAVKNNATSITTVAGSISNVNAVGSSISNVNSVAGDLTNIDTVAGDISDVSTVASDITKVSAVADDLTNIDAVADDLTNIDTVAGDISDISTVASNISDIQSASTNAGLAKQYAVGLPSEPAEGSAKYWAQQASTGQIQSDWSQADNTKKDYIKNKPTTLSSFTDNLCSSPTHTHSQYEVISKAVNTLDTSGTVTLTDNSINTITPTGAVTFSLPSISDNTVFHQILVQVNLSTVYTLTLGTSYYFNKTAPDMSSAGVYNLIYEYDKANQYWVVGCIEKGTA